MTFSIWLVVSSLGYKSNNMEPVGPLLKKWKIFWTKIKPNSSFFIGEFWRFLYLLCHFSIVDIVREISTEYLADAKSPPRLILGPIFSRYYNVIVGPMMTISVRSSNNICNIGGLYYVRQFIGNIPSLSSLNSNYLHTVNK